MEQRQAVATSLAVIVITALVATRQQPARTGPDQLEAGRADRRRGRPGGLVRRRVDALVQQSGADPDLRRGADRDRGVEAVEGLMRVARCPSGGLPVGARQAPLPGPCARRGCCLPDAKRPADSCPSAGLLLETRIDMWTFPRALRPAKRMWGVGVRHALFPR